MEEKRRFARAPFDGSARLTIGTQQVDVILADLSLRGALVELPPDTSFSDNDSGVLDLQLEDSDIAIALQCRVTHCQPGRVGVEFQRVDVDAMQHLRRLVELNLGNSEEHELGFLADLPRED